MNKPIKIILSILVILIAVYFIGPKPPSPELNRDLPSLPASIRNLDAYIYGKESAHNIRPDNESRIVWAEGITGERTDYSLLYLHGFSASWYEGYPANIGFARHFGMNAYLPRLAAHGLDAEDPLLDMTPDNLWKSAKEALMIARTLGRKVIIMSTSTGGTLALKLAADFPEYVDGLILYSPNIRINNSTAFLLSGPWGLQLARRVYNDKYRVTNEDFASKDCQYWNCRYRLEAVVYLQQLVDEAMKKETFSQVTAPVFLGYYYKDDKNQDQVVRVDAMLKMFDQLGTSPDQKVKVSFPEAGSHVIASELTSGAVNEVMQETLKFGEDILNLKRKSNYRSVDF
jgi:esterase/lipase